MNTDTAILLVIADLQRQIEALKAENAALHKQSADPASDAPATTGAWSARTRN